VVNTKYGGGIVIGGNVQFGELATVVSLASSTANLSFANNVSLGSAVRTFTQGNNGTQTFSGIVSNTSGGITFAANASTDGLFAFTNTANTFTGDVNINGGEVRFTADGGLGDAANDIILDGGRFGIASGATVTLGAGRQILVGDGIGTGISAPGGAGVLTYNGVIANKSGETGSWAKQGQGTLILSGASTYTGNTAINNGIVKLTTGNDRLPTGTVVSLGQAASTNLGTLDLNGRNQQIAGLNSTSGSNASASNNTVTSTAAATLTVGGSGNYSYGNRTNANSGVIAGAISLVKEGSGTQSLGDTNTYTGTTTVSAGKLVINGNITTSITTVSSGGTLGGVGTVGAITVNSGGTLAPGSSPGILNAGNTTLNTGSMFEWEIDTAQSNPETNRGVAYDGLNTSALAGTGAIFKILLTGTQDFTDAFWNQTRTWTDIFKSADGSTNLSNWASVFSGGFQYSYKGQNVVPTSQGYFTTTGNSLTWSAVPEPSNAIVGLIAAAGLLRRRRVC
jgi:autotransporter-associated beta strand protein